MFRKLCCFGGIRFKNPYLTTGSRRLYLLAGFRFGFEGEETEELRVNAVSDPAEVLRVVAELDFVAFDD